MNPSRYAIRTDRATGDMWLIDNRPPMRRLKNITNDVLLNFCADLVGGAPATASVVREVRFSDGTVCKLTAEIVDAPVS